MTSHAKRYQRKNYRRNSVFDSSFRLLFLSQVFFLKIIKFNKVYLEKPMDILCVLFFPSNLHWLKWRVYFGNVPGHPNISCHPCWSRASLHLRKVPPQLKSHFLGHEGNMCLEAQGFFVRGAPSSQELTVVNQGLVRDPFPFQPLHPQIPQKAMYIYIYIYMLTRNGQKKTGLPSRELTYSVPIDTFESMILFVFPFPDWWDMWLPGG